MMRYRLYRWVTSLVMLLMLGAQFPAVATGAEPPGMTEEQAIALLRTYDIVRGVPGGDLQLDQKLTRAQAAAIFIRSQGAESMAEMLRSVVSFNDTRNHWAAGEIAVAERFGLMQGDGNGRFRPDDDITYVEVLTVLLRMVEQEPAGVWNPAAIISASTKAGFAPAGTNLNAPAIRGKIFWALATAISRVPLPSGQTVLQKYIDHDPPRITPDHTTITTKEESVTISGKALEATSVVIGESSATLDPSTGRFEGTVELPLGRSSIVIAATDAAGNKATATVTAERKPNIVRLEIHGTAMMQARTAQKLTITAVDPRGQAVPLDGTQIELTGDVATFDLATSTLTAGSQTGSGALTLRYEKATATFAFEVTDVSPRAHRLAIAVMNGGKEPVVGQEVTIQVQVLDAAGRLVTDDYWRSIFVSVGGGSSITVPHPMATTSKGTATFQVTAAREGRYTLRASSPGLSDGLADLRFLSPIRIVLEALTDSLPPDGTSETTIRAYLRDQDGQPVSNTSSADIKLRLTAQGGDGTLKDSDLVIKKGHSDSSSYDATFQAGLESDSITLSALILSAHEYSVLPATISPARLPGVRLAISYSGGVQSPGSDASVEVRVLDSHSKLVTSGSYAFQIDVTTSNHERETAGLPAGVLLNFPNETYRPVGRPGTDKNAVIGRTYKGRAELRLRYDKSGVVTLTPVLTGPSYEAYHPDSGFGPAAQSSDMGTESVSITFAGKPHAIRLTADSVLGDGLAVGAMGPDQSIHLRAEVVDADGLPIYGYNDAIQLERAAHNGVTSISGASEKHAVNGVAEFTVKASSSAGTDVYRAATSDLTSHDVSVSVRIAAPDTPQVAAVRGIDEGDLSPVIGYVGPDAEYLDIQLRPQAPPVSSEHSYWVLAKVFRTGESSSFHTALVDLKADPPIIRVDKAELEPGRATYEVTVQNGCAQSARSADTGLSEALNVVYRDSYAFSAAYFDADSGRLALRTADLETGGTIDPAAFTIVKGENVLPLDDPTVRVAKISARQVIIELGDLAAALRPDRYNGEVLVKGAAGWYQSADGVHVARAVTGVPMTPAANITHAALDNAGHRLYLYGAGLSSGSLDLAKLRLISGESSVNLLPKHDKIVSATDGLVVLNLSSDSMDALRTITGHAIRLEAATGWLTLTVDGAAYQAAALREVDCPIYIQVEVNSVAYDRSADKLTLRGSGFADANLNPEKLIFRVTGTSKIWSPTGRTVKPEGDTVLSLVLNGDDATAFESKFGGHSTFMNTADGWLTDAAGHPAAAIPTDSILFSVPAH